MTKRGDIEMLDMLTSVFDEEAAQRIHLETLVKERTAELNDQLKQAEVERLNTIVENSLDLGADRATIIRQLVRRGDLDETTAETFLNAYQSANGRVY